MANNLIGETGSSDLFSLSTLSRPDLSKKLFPVGQVG